MKMPLPPEYFQCPPLSREECEQYEHQALQNIQELLEKADVTNPRYEWQRVSHEAEIEIFRGRDSSTLTSAALFCSTLDIAGTLDEVANIFRMRTRDEFKETIDRSDSALLDGAVLYTVQESSSSDIRLHWLLEKKPIDVIGKERDFCFLTSTQLLDRDGNGRHTWIRCFNSVQIPSCPEFSNVIRALLYCSGFVCRESERPGYVNLMSVMHIDLRGTLPSTLKERAVMDLCRTVRVIDRNLRENRLIETPFLPGEQFVKLSSREQCYLCKRSFCFFRKKKNCFKCGEVVCTQCGPKWNIKIAGTSVKVRACTTCSLLPWPSLGRNTAVSTLITPSSIPSTDVWNRADVDDSDDDDDDDEESSFVSFITASTMSRYSISTGGRPTFDHSQE
ncbi:hypothetical protein Ae201684_012215 [Aphanomyces euteiches]|uniref:FYVE-type domain-containing protein n=1 Tax=Aphanomyces euteiches TaxID=100861 RepID=A0A6G0WRV6_9STRA|nr:hypothetical protein Ae201684_012215 [Aphanomyces euteiches]KAH9138843.1 hypothetical protein AeRB84_016855 [Aphanomyces euteiches]